MADIFGKNVVVAAGPLGRSETFEVYLGANGADISSFLGLAQGVQNSYSQQLQRVFELGSSRAFMVSGRPQGSLSIIRLVGQPGAGIQQPTLLAALQNLSGGDSFLIVDGSAGGKLTLRERTTGAEWRLSGCYVTQESTGVDANGVLVSENVAIEYQKMEYVSGQAAADPNSNPIPNTP